MKQWVKERFERARYRDQEWMHARQSKRATKNNSDKNLLLLYWDSYICKTIYPLCYCYLNKLKKPLSLNCLESKLRESYWWLQNFIFSRLIKADVF